MDTPITNEQFKKLAIKCQNGTATQAEQEVFNNAYSLLSGRHTEWDNELMRDEETVKSDIYLSLTSNLKTSRNKKAISRLYKYAIAASVLIFASFGIYFLANKQSPIEQITRNKPDDLKPGENKATLTLSNGQKIILTKNMTGQLSKQGSMNIQMAPGGKVIYTPANKENTVETAVTYNTLTTKKGEQFPLVLADGTQVTLDAASSITFPVSFSGNERKVTITGQAYFKVVHNEQKPFLVNVKGQTIRDIGTEFNINAYDDEGAVQTTLLAGCVKVSKANESLILMPGQQSQVADNSDKITLIKNINTSTAVAWKNGLFQYDNANIQTVMRQFARWYDMDIQYEGAIPKRTFSGKMQRNLNASQVLDLLSFTKIHFRIEGKKVIVTP
jgi:transmembrane sensor